MEKEQEHLCFPLYRHSTRRKWFGSVKYFFLTNTFHTCIMWPLSINKWLHVSMSSCCFSFIEKGGYWLSFFLFLWDLHSFLVWIFSKCTWTSPVLLQEDHWSQKISPGFFQSCNYLLFEMKWRLLYRLAALANALFFTLASPRFDNFY